jgi:Major Facilitator Superfamily.
VLITGRVLQGIGSALIAPTALSLVATTFPPGPERNKAMGVYGAMGGLGSTVGLLLGGLLTEYVSWRWVLFVNIPVALAVLLGTNVLAGGDRERGRIDFPGAITVTASMVSLVYAITRASTHGWSDTLTLGFLGAALVLLVVFIIIQSVSRIAMMPGHVVRNRTRAGANVAFMLVGAGMFGTYYFLTLYMQGVKHYSAMQTGLAYLPFVFGMAFSAAALGPKLLTRLSPRGVIVLGLLIGTGGMAWFAALSPTSSYLTMLALPMLISGLGLGMAFVSVMMSGVFGVAPQETGIASGLINTSQQIGGAIGLATLATVAASVTSGLLSSGGTDEASALTEGFTTAFLIGGAFYVAALLIALFTINVRIPRADAAPTGVEQPVAS